MRSDIIDLTGKVFTDWTVIHYIGGRHSFWLCRCKCGAENEVKGQHLRTARSTGCGCSADKRFAKRNTKHGKVDTPEYGVWSGMRARCSDPNRKAYKNYGGRGITVCERWSDFAAFYADMGPRPSKDHSIDRIDNDQGYSPDNCRWATRAEQNRNHRRNRYLELNGERKTVTDWALRLGITQQAMQDRLNKWPLERALTAPKGG